MFRRPKLSMLRARAGTRTALAFAPTRALGNPDLGTVPGFKVVPSPARFGSPPHLAFDDAADELAQSPGTREPRRTYGEDPGRRLSLRRFVNGEPRRLLGLWKADRHIVGVERGTWFPHGTGRFGLEPLSPVIAVTLALPGYILGERALSILALGIEEPMTS